GARRGDHGATAIEYALMVSMIAVVIIASITLFGKNLIELFKVPSSSLTGP
ncbi:MAG: Flp family type IVb pilin, partial [Pedococcus sp.]